MDTPLLKLGSQIATEQNERLRDLHLSEFDLLRIPGRSYRHQLRRWVIAVVLFLVGVVAVTALVVAWKKAFARLTYQIEPKESALGVATRGQDHERAGRWVAAREGRSSVVSFSDGSRIRLEPDARMRVIALGRNGAELALEQGIAHVRVEGSRLSEYHLWVGPFELTLPKGSMRASWDPMSLQLNLIVVEGYVVIAGCQYGAGRSVAAGRELGTRCSEP
jgi:hypothetical protein